MVNPGRTEGSELQDSPAPKRKQDTHDNPGSSSWDSDGSEGIARDCVGEDDAEGKGDLLRSVEREIRDCEKDMDEEDAPDWEFEDGETKSRDPNYTFCPAPHRANILRIFTRHFCLHPIFPNHRGTTSTPSLIRETAVEEMYRHCKRNGLAEVWAYLWSQWYAPQRWPLWARSTSPYLSRLRTTMTVENHWKQLKHHYLHFLHRPRLDHALFVICTQAVPTYMARAVTLEDAHRLGRAKQLTSFQTTFKVSWIQKADATTSDKVYETSVERWQCNCGTQALDTHHLCKHLVQAVPEPPMSFFTEVIRRRTIPLYRHPHLRRHGTPADLFCDDDGSITEGDDHYGIGKSHLLGERKGWVDILSGVAKGLLKRRGSGDGERDIIRRRLYSDASDAVSSSDGNIGDEQEEQEEVSYNNTNGYYFCLPLLSSVIR